MGRAIVKLKGHYLIWSSIVDAPIFTCDTADELERFKRQESGENGLRELPEQLARVEAKGTSAVNRSSSVDTIWFNRAGPNENMLTIEGIYRHFCLDEPIQDEWVIPREVIEDENKEISLYDLVTNGWLE